MGAAGASTLSRIRRCLSPGNFCDKLPQQFGGLFSVKTGCLYARFGTFCHRLWQKTSAPLTTHFCHKLWQKFRRCVGSEKTTHVPKTPSGKSAHARKCLAQVLRESLDNRITPSEIPLLLNNPTPDIPIE